MFKKLLFGVLLLWVAVANAQDGFRREIGAFLHADSLQAPVSGQIVLYGSSSLRLWKTAAQDLSVGGLQVVNRGFGGSQCSDANRWLEQVVGPHRPRWLIFYEGDNDLASGKSVDSVYHDLQIFISTVRRLLPDTRVLVLATKHSGSRLQQVGAQRDLNHKVKRLCKRTKNVWFVDTANPLLDAQGQPRADLFEQDQLHLNAAGYAIWARLVRGKMEQLR
jgi:lysophospholipase L1-like esterase